MSKIKHSFTNEISPFQLPDRSFVLENLYSACDKVLKLYFNGDLSHDFITNFLSTTLTSAYLFLDRKDDV